MFTSPNEVLDYWFGNTRHGALVDIQDRMRFWFFRSSPEFDAVQLDNIQLVENLAADPTSLGWDIERNPGALMALIIILDQFSRSVFRGTAKAFQSDEFCANMIARIVLKNINCTILNDEKEIDNWLKSSWFIEEYSPIERFFLCVALQHSEQLGHQETGIKIANYVGSGASEGIKEYFRNLKGFPMEHYEVIQRFGRFPHRNLILVRHRYP